MRLDDAARRGLRSLSVSPARARCRGRVLFERTAHDGSQHFPGDDVRRPGAGPAGDCRRLRRPMERDHHRRHGHVRQRRHPDRQDRRRPFGRARVALGQLRAREQCRGRGRRPPDRARCRRRQAGHLRSAAGRRHAEGSGHLPERQYAPVRGPKGAHPRESSGPRRGGAPSSRSTARRSPAGASATRRRRTAGRWSMANSPSSIRRGIRTS